jgi:hypothetical protein
VICCFSQLFYAQMADDAAGTFSDVARTMSDKMVAHVTRMCSGANPAINLLISRRLGGYQDPLTRWPWQRSGPHALDGCRGRPARLLRAFKLQKRVTQVGFNCERGTRSMEIAEEALPKS